MKAFVNHWGPISLVLAGVTAIIAIFGPWDFTQRVLLALITCMFLHFFEEFWFPGGFPYVGVKVMLGRDETDPKKWGANNLCSLFGNWGFLLVVYVLPLFLPQVRFLTLAAVMFAFLELFQHLLMFNVRLKRIYNPGLISAVFGMTPIAIYYFVSIAGTGLYAWYDFVIAIVWFVAAFLFFFRSPVYWKLGKVEGYDFTPRAAFGPELKNIEANA